MRCVASNPTARQQSPRSPGRAYRLSKRAVDLAGALIGIALLWPIVAIAAAWIKLVDGGPVFYRQWRVGKNGWLFRIWKLRTMHRNAERGGHAAMARRHDPRVLPGCRWIRKAHVDELPQLLNILAGHMSLVGPRPERPEVIEHLRSDLPGIERRLRATPGLTGLAQIRNGYANDVAGMRRKLTHDLQYLRQQSFLGDLQLILQTARRIWDPAAC